MKYDGKSTKNNDFHNLLLEHFLRSLEVLCVDSMLTLDDVEHETARARLEAAGAHQVSPSCA